MFLDVVMPQMNGLEVLRRIRQTHPELPVIVITAFGGSGVRAEAMRLGATAYLDKPFRVGDFLQTVRDALGSSAPGCWNSERAGGR